MRFDFIFDTKIVVKYCQMTYFISPLCFPSAVAEWDSDAPLKVKKGSSKDSSFIPVFITKHKFYTNSLSKDSLNLFPFPMLN